MKNLFLHHILFPEIPTYLEITASQTLFIVQSVLNFCLHWVYCSVSFELLFTMGTVHEYRTGQKIEARYREFLCCNFNNYPIKFGVTTHIDLELVIINKGITAMLLFCEKIEENSCVLLQI